MKFLTCVVVLLCLTVLVVDGFKKGEKGRSKRDEDTKQRRKDSNKPAGELKVDVTFRPKKCERKSQMGDTVAIHYTGTLEDGSTFDSSIARGQPFEFILGGGRVIPAFDQGLSGMCVGEKRKLSVPPYLAYGEEGRPPVIPPNSRLNFAIEMIELKETDPAALEELRQQYEDMQRQQAESME